MTCRFPKGAPVAPTPGGDRRAGGRCPEATGSTFRRMFRKEFAMNITLRKTLPLAVLLGFGLLPAASAAEAPERVSDSRGFIYGRVTTRGGTVYEGRLRWNKEEAFWGDFFNASKKDLPYLEYIPKK